jgi:hypothetical protein
MVSIPSKTSATMQLRKLPKLIDHPHKVSFCMLPNQSLLFNEIFSSYFLIFPLEKLNTIGLGDKVVDQHNYNIARNSV